MVDEIKAAQIVARKSIEATYFGELKVTEQRKVKDKRTKLMTDKEVIVIENQPCRLSFEKIQTSAQSDSAASLSQMAKLFLSPDIRIKAGSKLTVSQDGITTDYTHSGVPAVYPTHQEIVLDLFKEYA